MHLITRTSRVLLLLSIATLFAANVFASVVITPSNSLPSGTVSVPYSATLSAAGGTSPYRWSITSCSGACNTGLGWSNSGVLSGTPANAGTSTFGFGVTDAAGKTASASLTITMSAPSSGGGSAPPTSSALRISTTSLPTGTTSAAYSATLSATGGKSPYTWAITSCSGACNTGLGWSTSGVLSGKPANAGTSAFGFGVTDAAGKTASASFAVNISTTAPTASVAITITPASSVLNTGITQQFSARVSNTTNTAATWWVNGIQGGNSTIGTISAAGLYTAPSSVPSGGSVTVTAKSVADGTKSASAGVSIVSASAPAVKVSINPTSSSVTTGKSQQFSASVSGTTSTGIAWQVNNVTGGNSTVGSVSSSGMYTAPSTVPTGGLVTVTARSSYDSTKAAAATVSLTAPASTTPPPTPPPSTGPAASYYVAPSGSNSNPCTQSSPCATLDYVFNSKAAAGQTVQAAAGTYSYGGGALTLSSSGSAGKYKKLSCATRGACKITNSVTGNAAVVMLTGNYITLDGFEVTNSGNSNNLGLYVTGSNVQITRNTIHHIETDCSDNGGGGIQLANGVNNIVMDANMIYDISWASCNGKPSVVQTDGILAETTGSGVQITNNIVYHVAGGWGILYGNSSGNSGSAVISNNTVFSNANGGIAVVNGGDYSTISNNIVVDNGVVSGQCGIWTIYAADSHILMANNDVYGNTGGNYCPAGSPVMSGNISNNPALGTTFVNWQADGSGNYQEQSASPTRRTGTTSCAPGSPAYISAGACASATDYNGNVRTVGTGWDIGAYEY